MRRNDQPSRPNAMTCSRFSLLKTWLMTTEANFPLQQLCLKPSLYGRFSLDHLWPLLGDHRGFWAGIRNANPVVMKLARERFGFESAHIHFPFWDNRNISGKGRICYTSAAIDERLGGLAPIKM
jgi:hypothetical protein